MKKVLIVLLLVSSFLLNNVLADSTMTQEQYNKEMKKIIDPLKFPHVSKFFNNDLKEIILNSNITILPLNVDLCFISTKVMIIKERSLKKKHSAIQTRNMLLLLYKNFFLDLYGFYGISNNIADIFNEAVDHDEKIVSK